MHHFFRKGADEDALDAIDPVQDLLPVGGRVDERRGLSGDHLPGMPVKGKHRRGQAQFFGPFFGFIQQCAVAQMDAIKKAQRQNDVSHSVMLRKSFSPR